jgi:archaellum component FlaG (FlaF/FlaG flagellin family)
MDKVMVTVLLLIAGVVCSMVLLNAVYPAITGSSGAIVDAASKVDDRIRSNIAIIQIADSDANDEVYIWIKNVGASSIGGISQSDVFFGLQGNFVRIPFDVQTPKPYWLYTIENDTRWGPGATLKITIHYTGDLEHLKEYYFKMVTPNGISAQDYYSVPAP